MRARGALKQLVIANCFGRITMLKSKLALALPLAIMTLVGCSSSDTRYDPVEAPEVENLFGVANVWDHSTGGTGGFYSELVVAFDSTKVYSASRSGDVIAADKTSGETIWSVDLAEQEENANKRSARLSGGVALSGNKIAVGSENGYVYVLNAADGSLLWKQYIEAEVIAKPAFNASGDKLFVLDSRGNFTAFDTQSAEKLWVTGDAPQILRLRSQATPLTIGDDYILVGTSSGKVNVVLQSNGATVNQIDVGDPIGANALERVADVSGSPLVLGNVLYASSYAGGLVEYDLSTFNYLSKLGYQSSRDFGFDENSILVTADDGTISCINRFDNSQRWANTQLAYRNVTTATVFGDYAVVGDYEGYYYFLDMTDGSIDYMDEVDGSAIYTAPIVNDGKLYLLTEDGTLACLDYADADKRSKASSVQMSNDNLLANAAAGLSLNHPGVYEGGIYAPNSVSEEQLQARRQAIIRAVAQQEAQIAAQRRAAEQAAKARAEYEARVKEYEENRREQLSGFGIAQGVRSDLDDVELQTESEDTEQVETQDTEDQE